MTRSMLAWMLLGLLTAPVVAQDAKEKGGEDEPGQRRPRVRANREGGEDDEQRERRRERWRNREGGEGRPGFGFGPGGPGMGGMAEHLAEELSLTDEQRAEYDEITAAQRERMTEMRKGWEAVREAEEAGDDEKAQELRAALPGREAWRDSMNQTMEEIEPILDDEQHQKFSQMRQDMERRGQAREQFMRMSRELPDELQMDEGQRQQFEEFLGQRRQQFMEKMQEMRPVWEELRAARDSGDKETADRLQQQLRDMEPQFEKMREESMQQLREMLPEAQRKRFDGYVERMNTPAADPQKNPKDVRAVMGAAARLRLDREQRAAWKTIRREVARDIRKIKPDDAAAQEQFAAGVKAKIVKILNEEQAAQYEEKLQELGSSSKRK